jgi:hypothetical protein
MLGYPRDALLDTGIPMPAVESLLAGRECHADARTAAR